MQASRNAFFTEHLWMTTSGVEVFCKKGVKKKSLHFIWKHLWWSLFLIKRQAWDLLWRTSANYCFCTALASLAVPYLFYFIFSTFFFIITATTVNISFFLVQIQKASKNLNLVSHFHWSHFIGVILFFYFFFCLCSFFPVAANQKDFLC